MKKIIYVAFAAVIFFSCTKEEVKPTIKSETGTTTLKNINGMTAGEIHNYYMDVFYNALKTYIDYFGLENMNRAKFTQAYGRILNTFSGESAPLAKTTGLRLANAVLDAGQQNLYDVDDYIVIVNNQSNISNELKSFLTDFLNSTKNALDKTSTAQIVAAGREGLYIFSGVEYEIANGTVDVFEKSIDYWIENRRSWIELGNPDFEGEIGFPTSVGGADAGGFAVGAAVGAAGGTAVLPGVGTVGGWLGVGASGGLLASGASAIGALWDWIWS